MKNSEGQLKKKLDQIYSSVGNALHVRSIGKLPRDPQDLHSDRYQVSKSQKLKANHKTE